MKPKQKKTLHIVPERSVATMLFRLTDGWIADTDNNRKVVEQEIEKEGYFLLNDPSETYGWLCIEPAEREGWVKISKVLRFEV